MCRGMVVSADTAEFCEELSGDDDDITSGPFTGGASAEDFAKCMCGEQLRARVCRRGTHVG